MMRCNTCGGTYDQVLEDGSAYYHACAPVTVRPVVRGGRPIEVPIDQVQPTDLVTVLRGRVVTTIALSTLGPDDVIVGDRTIERPNRRDENVAAPADRVRGRTIKAEGAGATRV